MSKQTKPGLESTAATLESARKRLGELELEREQANQERAEAAAADQTRISLQERAEAAIAGVEVVEPVQTTSAELARLWERSHVLEAAVELQQRKVRELEHARGAELAEEHKPEVLSALAQAAEAVRSLAASWEIIERRRTEIDESTNSSAYAHIWNLPSGYTRGRWDLRDRESWAARFLRELKTTHGIRVKR